MKIPQETAKLALKQVFKALKTTFTCYIKETREKMEGLYPGGITVICFVCRTIDL